MNFYSRNDWIHWKATMNSSRKLINSSWQLILHDTFKFSSKSLHMLCPYCILITWHLFSIAHVPLMAVKRRLSDRCTPVSECPHSPGVFSCFPHESSCYLWAMWVQLHRHPLKTNSFSCNFCRFVIIILCFQRFSDFSDILIVVHNLWVFHCMSSAM